jgi:hypothetical protein
MLKIAKDLVENNNTWHTIIVTFNKLIGVLVPRMELCVKFFNAIDTPLEIDAPIGLRIVFINTNDCGKQT